MTRTDAEKAQRLNRAEIDDIILLLEHHIESGEDGIERQFCLTEDQPEDMMNNLQSALKKLKG